jgi:hypothetical protein
MLWVSGSAIAAVIALLKPVLRLTDRLKTFQDLYTGYTDLEFDCETIASKVKQDGKFTPSHHRWFLAAKAKERNLATRAPAERNRRVLARRLQQEVLRELPRERFYIPTESTSVEAPSSS